MIETFVKRPATTVMFVLVFVLLGFVSFFNLNIEQSPRIDFPLVVVNLTYPGASPEQIESQAIKKVEEVIAEISEIKKVDGRAYENFGYVLIEFFLSADVNVKSIEVKDKVEAILNDFPDAMERPIIQKVDPFASSVVDLILTSDRHNTTELYEYADKELKTYFSQITGVGEIEIRGGQERSIIVDLYPDLMKNKFISISEVVTQMRARNITVPAGNIDQRSDTVSVRFEGEFFSIDQIRELRLTTQDGSSFTLGEIARVYDGSKDIEKLTRFNEKEAIGIAVKKMSGGNDVSISEGVRGLVPEVGQHLPEGMKLEVALDKAQNILTQTYSTFNAIVLGILLTVVVLLFFTGNFRVTVISAIVIPTSIISTFFLMDMSQFTINFITLLAVATCLGTLIANAIVIIESVLKHLSEGKEAVEAAVQGTKDVTVPVLAACGTNLVVFTPIAFMGGIIGQFMQQFGMTVIYATLFSLIASFSLTPMLCGLLLKAPKESEKNKKSFSDRIVGFFLMEYRHFFNFMFKIPFVSVVVAILLFIGSLTVLPYVGNEFIPVYDRDRLEVTLTLPDGSNVFATLQKVKEVEQMLNDFPEVASVVSFLGQDGEQNASVVANLLPFDERERSDLDIIAALTPKLANMSNVEVQTVRGDDGGNGFGDVSMHVTGPDYEQVINESVKLMRVMREMGYFRSLTSSYKTPKTELKFYPDLAEFERYGVTGPEVANAIRAAIYGDDTNIYREAEEEYDITIRLSDDYLNSTEALAEIYVVTQRGLVPVTALGELSLERSIPTIYRRDRRRVIQLDGFLAKSTAGVVQNEIAEKMEEIGLAEGVQVNFVGNAESQDESGREIGKAFMLAVVLTYMILAAILNSFIHPFTIATSIITSFGGVFMMLFFMDSSINIASMLGFIMLVGLAVNNAILYLEAVETKIAQDPEVDLREALWVGFEERFKPILMTSIAIVLGATPQMFEHDLAKASMGMVIVGGVLASILFTFILTPQMYWYFERMRRFTKRIVLGT